MAHADFKKNGRFIKKGDPLHKVLSVTDFSLAEICETPIAFHDNANANIIHNKLHLKEELAESVRGSHEIDAVFTVPEERVVIHPLDFTEEWRRMRRRQSTRLQRTDDDDDFDLDQARAGQQDLDSSEAEEAAPKSEEAPIPQTAEPAAPDIEAPIAPPAPQAAPAPQPEPTFYAEEEGPEEEFVPYASNATVPLERAISEEELEAIRQEAREEGFRKGYASGEEKAALESRSKIQAILQEVSNIVENLEGLQSSILNQAQNNFYVICKNFVEAMLHREFSLNAEAFGAMIERAITEALNEDEFKIFVSPRVAKDLKDWSNERLRSRLKADDGLKDYSFRVEGQHASVDEDLQTIIKNLLDKADLSLFDSQHKVG